MKAFDFVEEYYDPLTFREGMIESYGEGIKITRHFPKMLSGRRMEYQIPTFDTPSPNF